MASTELVVRAPAGEAAALAKEEAEFEFVGGHPCSFLYASTPTPLKTPPNRWWGLKDYIKSIVFGGLDGIVTTFAIIASVVGADL
jgi:hypothetical protein